MAPDPGDGGNLPGSQELDLLRFWEGRSVDALREAWGVDVLEVHGWIDSTNDRARTLLGSQRQPAGALVVLAEGQRGGRGRQGRSWHSPHEKGIWLSVAVPTSPRGLPPVTPLRVGLVVAEAIERWVGAERVTIKWPNDVLLAGRKVGGILCEGVSTRGGILGVGINVLQEPEEFPPEIRESATSLAQHADLPVDRGQLAGVLIEGLKKLGAESSLLLESAELGRISARDALLDRPVATSGGVVGRGKGITPEGTLLIQDTRGQVHSISSGTVRIREPAS